jgi:hypothetical protein
MWALLRRQQGRTEPLRVYSDLTLHPVLVGLLGALIITGFVAADGTSTSAAQG